jgi:hypothetical protein
MKDSRQHRFAYLIRNRKDFPEDFPHFTGRTLFPALFLPRDDPDWFGRSSNPPRVVLFTGETLELHFHPESGKAFASIPCDQDLSIQTACFLLIGWIGFASKGADLRLPYNRRVDEPVRVFLGMLRARLLRTCALSTDQAFLGDVIDLKFQNTLNHEIDKGEVERARLFIAPRLCVSGHWPFRINRWTPGHVIALTDRRLLWISERYRRARAQYGSVACYACIESIAHVETSSVGGVSQLSISLRNGKIWDLEIPEELWAHAREFAAIAEARSTISRDLSRIPI